MRRWQGLNVACCLVLALLASTAVAQAHADLQTAVPAPGSTVQNPVGSVRLVFSQPVTAASQILLFAADFQPVPGLQAQTDPADPAVLWTAVPALAPGLYTVQYTAVAADGHETSGSYTFRVSDGRWSFSTLSLAVMGMAVLLLAGFVIRWRRSSSPLR